MSFEIYKLIMDSIVICFVFILKVYMPPPPPPPHGLPMMVPPLSPPPTFGGKVYSVVLLPYFVIGLTSIRLSLLLSFLIYLEKDL
jgi:hypothetical protein